MFNFSGYINAQLQDSRRYTDEDLKRAIADGTIGQILADMPVELESAGPNQILNPTSSKFFYHQFTGISDPGYRNQYAGAYFTRVYLSSDTTQLAWTAGGDAGYICWNGGTNVVGGGGNISRNLGAINSYGLVEEKRINEEANTPTGLRAVHVTHTFLWLNSDANASNIRGIRCVASDNGDLTSQNCYYANYVMQHRFLDSGGNPITITKNSNQTFCVRWTITYKSI